ncbi:gluconate 2-dehydrogenase subunit 3 family protein [Fulvivirga lutimaris]|uniref:gluconate 2-dehydrogenase subunit 3 family protein n=1 Tax=Fulvivirga lutimaris TaxID=1819566 RepID=UPI0012BC8551|nr:gluconate 2-dehydrogenase subunit 3 family protein [Fulvivirga lutimaris]MTI39403.1 gluconate 2-dehydrogenase subunit 3 family protein [Fulvivirga lutimaris]
MNRREAIKRTSMMLGIAASSPVIMSILDGCVPQKELGWIPGFFNEDQAILVADICDIILPKTSTPGALDIGVDVFIDHIVGSCLSTEEQAIFSDGLIEVEAESNKLEGKNFSSLSNESKTKVLETLEAKTDTEDYDPHASGKPFFAKIKELTLLGYFTSEEIMTQHLDYVPIPAGFEGCNELKEGQKLKVGNHV